MLNDNEKIETIAVENLKDGECLQKSYEGVSSTKRPFALWLYLLIVFGLSWPFQIIAAIWGWDLLPRYTLHAASMTMVTVGTFICGRYVFKDGFGDAGRHWGKLKHYLAVVGLVLLLWVVPAIVDLLLGKIKLPEKLTCIQWIWIAVFMLDFIPCFGEEFGWRGYMLPRLAKRYTPRKAVFVHSVIWWVWHWPVLIGIGAWIGITSAEEMKLPVVVASIITAAAVVILGALPSILHGAIIAYFWVWSGSLAVVTVYHLAYDGIRDSIGYFIGGGDVSGFFGMLVSVLLGAILIWKGNWKKLEKFGYEKENHMAGEAGG